MTALPTTATVETHPLTSKRFALACGLPALW